MKKSRKGCLNSERMSRRSMEGGLSRVLRTPLKRKEQRMLRQSSPAHSSFHHRPHHSLSPIPLPLRLA